MFRPCELIRSLLPMLSVLVLVALVGSTIAEASPVPLRVRGLVAATFTPFHANGSINPQVVELQAAWLNETGVRWVFVSGTTGESVKLTVQERKDQAELWVKVAPRYRLGVIVHVGTESTREARDLAAHAEAVGADAIGAMPPVFFKPATVQDLVATMSSIFGAAPKLPAYYYHIPSKTGVTFPMIDFVQEMDKLGTSAGNFAGVKYTGLYSSPGFMDMSQVLEYKQGKYEVLGGRDEMMIETLAAGAVGFVGSQYNFAADLYDNIIRAWDAGDLKKARTLQAAAVELLVATHVVSPGVDGCKNVMNVMDAVPVGDDRLPGVPMSTEDSLKLKRALVEACRGRAELQELKICRHAELHFDSVNLQLDMLL